MTYSWWTKSALMPRWTSSQRPPRRSAPPRRTSSSRTPSWPGAALMRERLPDVYDRLLAVGAVEAPLSAFMLPTLADRSSWPGGDRLAPLLVRRSTLDWVLLRAVLGEPGVELRTPVRVVVLITAPGNPPRVTGLHTSHGDIDADFVIEATGRRSPLGRWLVEVGARPPARWQAECGLAYFGRPLSTAPDGGSAWCDRDPAGAWSGRVHRRAVRCRQLGDAARDSALGRHRRFLAVRQPKAFTALLRTIPAFAAWLDVLDPISPVYPMAGLHNTLRRLVVEDGPVVTGLHAIGDSVCTTNPTLGRGLTLAIQGAAALADTLAEHPCDPVAQALALDELIADHVAPYYEDQAAIDAERLALLRHTVFRRPRTATGSRSRRCARPPPSTRSRSARSGGSSA